MRLSIDMNLTPLQLAESFIEMTDEQQAQVFIEIAKPSMNWTALQRMNQWFSVGRHLRDCSCSNDGARELVIEIADGVKP